MDAASSFDIVVAIVLSAGGAGGAVVVVVVSGVRVAIIIVLCSRTVCDGQSIVIFEKKYAHVNNFGRFNIRCRSSYRRVQGANDQPLTPTKILIEACRYARSSAEKWRPHHTGGILTLIGKRVGEKVKLILV